MMNESAEAQSAQKRRNILIAVAVVLVAALAGVFFYFHTADSRYAEKCKEAETVTTDVRDFLVEIDDLKGDPDGDDVKEYLDRLSKAETNLEKLAGDLKSMRVSGKNEGRNQALVEAILLEKDILTDTETVLKAPTDAKTADVIGKLKGKASELDERAAKLTFETVDFAAALKLDGLDDRLKGYVKKKEALDAQKKAEAERKAREAAEAKRKAQQKKIEDRNQTLMNTTSDVIYLATNVKRTSPSRLDIDGFFYNGTPNRVVSVDDMMLDVTLYKDGEVVYSQVFTFGKISLGGWIPSHERQGSHLWVNDNNGTTIPEDFDDFVIEAANVHWTYYR